MDELDILVVAGSSRRGSLNATLAQAASATLAGAGHHVTQLDLRALGLPVYDGDLEAASGVPEGAFRLQEALEAADGLLVVTPEYNGFPTPLVINAFDWLSRIQAAAPRRAGLATTMGKPAALLSASPGAGGALRAMNYLRQYLQMAFQMIVVPQQFALGRAHEAFGPDGLLVDPKTAQAVAGVTGALSRLAQALRQSA